MRILWLAPEPPVPPLSGGRERARRMIEYLAARHEVHLVTFAAEAEQAGLAELRPQLAGVISTEYETAWYMPRRPMTFPDLPRFDAIHSQGFTPPRAVAQASKYILELHDIPTSLRHLHACRRKINAASGVVVVSPADRDSLLRTHPAKALTILPNGVDTEFWSRVAGAPGEATLLFPAALNWRPNIEAARRLIEQILPRLRARIPHLRLIIAGRLPSPQLRALAGSQPHIDLMADPPDMRPIFAQATAVVVPIEGASGTRLKILQALAAGRPVISTPNGAAGLSLEPGKHLMVADLGQPFVEAVAQVLADADLRGALVSAGREVAPRYDWQHCLPILDSLYPL